MLALLLTIALRQLASPLPAESAVPATPAASVMPAAPESPAMPVIDRFPRRMPYQAPHMTTGDILIRDTGSTNTEGYTIVMHADYSADVVTGGTPDRKTIAEPQAKWLYAIVKAAGPLDELAVGRCMKSASFGTRTFITYDGKTSPDLSCGGGDSVREINRTVGIITTQLGVAPAPGRFRRRLLQ